MTLTPDEEKKIEEGVESVREDIESGNDEKLKEHLKEGDSLLKQAQEQLAKYEPPEDTGSEFGKGFMYCLSLFSEHLGNDQVRDLGRMKFLHSKTDEERALIFSDNPPPELNYGKDIEYATFWYLKILPIYHTFEKAFSSQLETWANGASDHLYEIETPEIFRGTEIEEKVLYLQNKALSMGHGFTGIVWTWDDYIELHTLTRDIVKLVDKHLGVEVIKGRWE